MGTDELHPAARLVAAQRATAAAGLDALLLTPGSDLRCIYLAGRHGARIEDIAVCTTDGGQWLNTTPTELIAL